MRVRRNTKSSPGLAIFMGIIFVFFAVVIFSMGTQTNNMRKRCTKSTTGIVQSVRQERRTRKRGKHRRETYYVYVTGYEFEADGKEYSGSSTLNSRISEGAAIKVNYNPSKPAEEHYSNYDSSGNAGIAASVVFGMIGIIAVIAGFKEKARQGTLRGMAAAGTGVVLNGFNGMNNNNNYNYNNYNSNGYNNGYNNSYNNNLNNNYNTYSNDYNNSFAGSNGYNDNNFNNGYSNNYNNNYNSNYNNNYNNGYNNGYNNNNVYSGGSNNYNDFNQLN
jgi:hypothetical protein